MSISHLFGPPDDNEKEAFERCNPDCDCESACAADRQGVSDFVSVLGRELNAMSSVAEKRSIVAGLNRTIENLSMAAVMAARLIEEVFIESEESMERAIGEVAR